MNRARTITQKVKTPFGSMYLHISVNDLGYPIGASISDPGKEPESQISRLVADLSAALDEALSYGREAGE